MLHNWQWLLLCVFQTAAGLGLGWWLFHRNNADNDDIDDENPHKEALLEQRIEELQRRFDSLSQMVRDVSGGIHEHAAGVNQASQDIQRLAESGQADSESLLAALSPLTEMNVTLQQRLAEVEDRLTQQSGELTRKSRELERQTRDARTDELTGLTNRRGFDEAFAREIEQSKARDLPLCLAMLDIDHFKKFNDTYGHDAGDAVLAEVARVLCETTTGAALACRFGGEEMAVLMPKLSLSQGNQLAEKMRAAIEANALEFSGHQLTVTASIGVAKHSGDENTPALLKRADTAMYAAKQHGRNRVYYHCAGKCHPFVCEQEDAAVLKPTTDPETRDVVRQWLDSSATPPEEDASTPAAAEPPQLQVNTAALPPETRDSRTDPLTGMLSRTGFREQTHHRLAEWRRFRNPLSMLAVQIDHLDALQGPAGPRTANVIRKSIAMFLHHLLRETDVVGRVSEDGFAVLLPGAPMTGASIVGDRIRKAVAKTQFSIASRQHNCSVSVVVTPASASDDPDIFYDRAGRAAMAVSQRGGNQCSVISAPDEGHALGAAAFTGEIDSSGA